MFRIRPPSAVWTRWSGTSCRPGPVAAITVTGIDTRLKVIESFAIAFDIASLQVRSPVASHPCSMPTQPDLR
ncbi:hypothetical protein GCM10010430_75750 [Kitasatospora cystarginea]|uniref:Uncharacterized protein n=1 Tax=Kitasatospora cystarginea TaxID=58350 RepID=A0ABN3EZQ5_9ACTN